MSINFKDKRLWGLVALIVIVLLIVGYYYGPTDVADVEPDSSNAKVSLTIEPQAELDTAEDPVDPVDGGVDDGSTV